MLDKLHNQTLNGIIESKKNTRLFARLFLVCFLSMLIFCGYIYFKSLSLVRVVEPNGRNLPSRLERKEQLLEAGIRQNVVLVNMYVNNINRMTLKEYISRARLLVSNSDLTHIFNTYKKNKYYQKAKEQGFEYKNEFKEFVEVNTDKYPYYVKYISKTTVYDGINVVDSFFIEGEGYATEQTPVFEETTHGFYLSDYKQTFKK